jgi:hypothetical protein
MRATRAQSMLESSRDGINHSLYVYWCT